MYSPYVTPSGPSLMFGRTFRPMLAPPCTYSRTLEVEVGRDALLDSTTYSISGPARLAVRAVEREQDVRDIDDELVADPHRSGPPLTLSVGEMLDVLAAGRPSK